MDVGFSLTVLC